MSGVYILKENDKMEQVQRNKIQVVVKNNDGVLLENAKEVGLKDEDDIKPTEYFLEVEEQVANVDIDQAQFVAIEGECTGNEDGDSQFEPLQMDVSDQIILQDKDVILWNELCRICANSSDKVVPIFYGEGLEHNLSKKIETYLPLIVTENDTLPLQVCYNCAATLLAWDDMTLNCLDAQQRLIELQNKLNSKNEVQNNISEGEEEEVTDNNIEIEAPSNQEDQMQIVAEEENPQETEQIVNESETDRAEQQQQQQDNYNYMCGVCERLYRREKSLLKHIRLKHPDDASESSFNYECNFCGKAYSIKAKLVSHMRLHEPKRRKQGEMDGEDELIERSKIFCRKTRKLLFKCQMEDCTAVLRSRRAFLRHMRVHKDERPIICEQCGKRYRIEDDLKRHIDDVHRKIKRHPCDICGRSSIARSSGGSFKNFRKNYKPCVPTSSRRNPTKVLPKTTGSRSSTRVPRNKTKVPDNQPSIDSLPPVKKEEKSDDDYFENDLNSPSAQVDESSAVKPSTGSKRSRRKQRLASPKSLECKQCGKAFRQRKSYDIHMRQHTGEKPFTCHICGKQFGQTGSLYYHLKHLHGGVKNHACDICGRCFAMKTAMEDHRRIHTGERPYVCDACGKTFKTKASLYIHSKIHTDEYPFNCSYCKKPFRWKQQMISHLTTHTGEKNHVCEICNKGFGVKNELTRHRRTHSTDKPFTCQKCGLSFGQKRYLTNHNRTRHKIKPLNTL